MSKERTYEEGYDDGYTDGRSDLEWLEDGGYDRGYKKGREDASWAVVRPFEAARRAGLPLLDGVCYRWDAAAKEHVFWHLNGQEVRING